MFSAEIHIYRIHQDGRKELVAVAPLGLKIEVDLAIQERNREADEAETGWKYYFDCSTPIQVFVPGYKVVLN